MKNSYHLCIATPTICFSEIYKLEGSYTFCFDIRFETSSISLLEAPSPLEDLNGIIASMQDSEDAQHFLDAVKKYFSTAGIHDGEPVSVLFSNGRALAIGAQGRDLWIDVRNGVFCHTVPLSFAALQMDIKSLEVY